MTRQIYAVYNADGSLWGEAHYVVRKLIGRAACALCDITHGLNPRGKAQWRAGTCGHTPVIWLHRDEQPPELAAFTEGRLPVVVVNTRETYVELLSADDLVNCRGDFGVFDQLLSQRLAVLGSVE